MKENEAMQPYTRPCLNETSSAQAISTLMINLSERDNPIPNEAELFPLFIQLKAEYRSSQIFRAAKETLITLFQMTKSAPPEELINLADTSPLSLTLRKVTEAYPDLVELPLTALNSLFSTISGSSPTLEVEFPLEASSDDSSPEIDRVIETGLFHSNSSEPTYVQFFQLVEEIELKITECPTRSDTIYLAELDGLISNPFVETALSQIPHDQLELRRLHLLAYSLKKLNYCYDLISQVPPKNIDNLSEMIIARIKSAFSPPIFPEKIIIDASDSPSAKPITKTICDRVTSNLTLFTNSLTFHEKSEALILTSMIESISFNLVELLYWKHFSLLLPYKSYAAFKETCESKKTTAVIHSLMQLLIKPTPHTQFGFCLDRTQTVAQPTLPSSSPAAAAHAEIAEEVETDLRTRRFPKNLTKTLPYHFSTFAAGLKAMDEGDLFDAVKHSNNLIKFYESLVDISGGFLPSYKCYEALADFFCLISDQLEILQRGNPSKRELYDANLVKLIECKTAAESYFVKYNPVEHITKNLTAFLEGLEILQTASILCDVKASKKQKA